MSENFNITFDNFDVLKKRNIHADVYVSLYAERFCVGAEGVKINECESTIKRKFGVSKCEHRVSSRNRISSMSGSMG